MYESPWYTKLKFLPSAIQKSQFWPQVDQTSQTLVLAHKCLAVLHQLLVVPCKVQFAIVQKHQPSGPHLLHMSCSVINFKAQSVTQFTFSHMDNDHESLDYMYYFCDRSSYVRLFMICKNWCGLRLALKPWKLYGLPIFSWLWRFCKPSRPHGQPYLPSTRSLEYEAVRKKTTLYNHEFVFLRIIWLLNMSFTSSTLNQC